MKTNVTPRRARSFWRNIEGNVAPIFGLMAIPMLGVVGAAIDFGQAQSKASVLQSALDASVVSAIREYRDTGNASSAANRLRNHFSSELSGSGMTLGAEPAEGETASNGPNEVLLENVGINTASQSVSPKASVNVPTSILKLIGIDSIDLEVSSAATMAGKALELTMVLDVTGSMCPNGNCTKLNDMKTAAKDLLDIVMPNGAEATRVGLVPFATYINVGWTDTAKRTGRTEYANYPCALERKSGARISEAAPASGSEFWILNNTSGHCPPSAPIVPLSNDRNALNTAIDGLTADGGTAGHLGIQWGWYLLSPLWTSVWPSDSAPAAYDDPKSMKAIVFFTDGNFTAFHRNANGGSSSCNGSGDCPESRAEAKSFCDEIKTRVNAKGEEAVTIFTIGFGLDPEGTTSGNNARGTLKYCASYDPDDPETDLALRKKLYFFPYDSSSMRSAFQNIGRVLAAARDGITLQDPSQLAGN